MLSASIKANGKSKSSSIIGTNETYLEVQGKIGLSLE